MIVIHICDFTFRAIIFRMLSEEEAIDFAEVTLGIPSIIVSLKQAPIQTLNTIIKHFHRTIPFQNIRLLSKPRGTQDVPTLDEIKHDVLSKQGGLCYTNNVFMKEFLKALGLQAYNASGQCNRRHANNHIVTIVCDIAIKGDIYLVDVGCGYPTYQLVSLNFDQQSIVYRSGFLLFKFVKENDQYTRFHGKHKDSVCCDNSIDIKHVQWERFYDFTLEPKPLVHFYPAMKEVYQDRFLRKFRALIFKDDTMTAIKEVSQESNDYKCCLIKLLPTGKQEILLDENHLVVNVMHLVAALDENTIQTAIHHWQNFKTRTLQNIS